NVINRKFNIDYGVIRWTGDPLDAYIDIKAIYPTKAALYGLLGYDMPGEDAANGNGDNAFKRKTTIYCQLLMTDKLMKPTIKYDIYLPTVDEETRTIIKNKINTEEELNKQFLSLLVLNSFYLSDDPDNLSSPYSNAAGVNASEFLSNQLSHWLSQISNDYDIRVNYRPDFDNQMTNDEVEFALSTQLLNDRLTIDGNVDVTTNAAAESSNNIVGDFDLDYKITEKFRLKAYNHSNDNLLTEVSPYTQGVGVVFKEEFNSVGELWKRYLHAIFGKKNKNALKK
ncbi:MAG: translocation/assembly module TamB domain-containing protein, partial [Bacteroidales bacterium]